jgi:hypothetical protein
MITKEEITEDFLKEAYDFASNNYRSCCQISKEIQFVLDGLSESDFRKVVSAAKSGWIKQLKELDIELAKKGEP